MTDFTSNSSKYGLKEQEFEHLEAEDKKQLLTLMARIMERAYRRGVQQALVMVREDRISGKVLSDLHSYRYDNDLNKSIGLDGFKTTSLERLMIEEGLEDVGLSNRKGGA